MTFEDCVQGLNPRACELEVLHENKISVRKMTSLRFGWGSHEVPSVFEVPISNIHLTWMLGMQILCIVKYVRIICGGSVQSRVKNEEPSERDSLQH